MDGSFMSHQAGARLRLLVWYDTIPRTKSGGVDGGFGRTLRKGLALHRRNRLRGQRRERGRRSAGAQDKSFAHQAHRSALLTLFHGPRGGSR